MAKRKGTPAPPISKEKNPFAVGLGRMGGQAIAKRGPEYFRQLQAKRKTRAGGKPKKTA
jgi:hypothetical protein